MLSKVAKVSRLCTVTGTISDVFANINTALYNPFLHRHYIVGTLALQLSRLFHVFKQARLSADVLAGSATRELAVRACVRACCYEAKNCLKVENSAQTS